VLLVHVLRKIIPKSIYPNVVKSMTRKDLQLDQLRRHSIRNYMAMTRTSRGQHFIIATGLTV